MIHLHPSHFNSNGEGDEREPNMRKPTFLSGLKNNPLKVGKYGLALSFVLCASMAFYIGFSSATADGKGKGAAWFMYVIDNDSWECSCKGKQ